MPTKPFTNTALYYNMMLESEPTPLATKWFGGFSDGSKANVVHYNMTLRSRTVVYLPLRKMMEFISWDDDIPH